MTEQKKTENAENGWNSYIFTIVNPDSGTHDIVVSYNSGATGYGGGFGVSLKGTDATDLIDSSGVATGTGTDVSVDITTTEDNVFIIDSGGHDNSPATETIGSGQTVIDAVKTQPNSQSIWASYKTQESAGSTTMSWTLGASRPWTECCIGINKEPGEEITISETITMTEAKTGNLDRTISESMSMTESITTLKGVISVISETIGLTEVISAVVKGWGYLTKHDTNSDYKTKHTTSSDYKTKSTTNWTYKTKN